MLSFCLFLPVLHAMAGRREYCRQPDANIGYVIRLGRESDNIALFQSFLNISKGQVFCILMMIAALVLFFIVNRRRKENVTNGKRKNR